jgi:integrase
VWRQFYAWINKPDLVPGTAAVVPPPHYSPRRQAAVIDKTWSGRGIDVPGKIGEIAAGDARVALVLELMLIFSLRLKEASLLRPHAADQGAYLDVSRGTKGRRRRVHKIATPGERAVLERAKALVADRTACLVPRHKTYKQWQNHVYYVLTRHGVSRQQVGISTHGLRHQGLNRLYEQITGARSPVRGGRPGEVDRATDRFARQQVAETAGHGKRSVSSAYLGGVLRDKESAAEIADPPSAPDDSEEAGGEDEDYDDDDEARQLVAALRDRISPDEELS